MNPEQITEALIERMRNPVQYIEGGEPLAIRFAMLKANYKALQEMVDRGLADWDRGDPYAIADWVRLFSPIEYDAWCEIRTHNLPLWPQFPVGPFFVDFGNPTKRIALECDGAEWHDRDKDAARDAELREMGWRVFRVTGSQCWNTRTMKAPGDFLADGEEIPYGYEFEYDEKTINGVIQRLKGILRG